MAIDCKTYREAVESAAAFPPEVETEAHVESCEDCGKWLDEHCAKLDAELHRDPGLMTLGIFICVKRANPKIFLTGGGKA